MKNWITLTAVVSSIFCMTVGNNILLAQDNGTTDKKTTKMKPVQKQEAKEVKKPDKAQETQKEEEILIPEDKLLPGRDIIEMYIKATGGREAILADKSQILTGTFSMPERGINGTYTMYRAAPSNMRMELVIPDFATFTQGYDGKVAWIIDPMMGARLIEDDNLANLQREADYYSILNYDKYYDTIKTLKGAKFEDMLCYEVSVIDKTGFETKQYYDTESHLLLGLKTVNDTPMGEMVSITTFKDYKLFDNMKIPTNTTISMPGMTQIMSVTDVKHVEIEPEKFILPDEVKELVAQKEKEKLEAEKSEKVEAEKDNHKNKIEEDEDKENEKKEKDEEGEEEDDDDDR